MNYDTWSEVASHICRGDWKNFIFTCKTFLRFHNIEKVKKYSNHLWTLIKFYPDKPWNNILISQNINTSFNIVEKYALYSDSSLYSDKINWEALSCYNLNITDDIILNNLDYAWDLKCVFYKRHFTWDIIQKNLDIYNDWRHISSNPHITMDIVLNNLNCPWNFCMLSKNRGILWDDIYTTYTNLCFRNLIWAKWEWFYISRNPNITKEIVEEHPVFAWDWNYLTGIMDFEWDFIFNIAQNHSVHAVNWVNLSYRKDLLWDHVEYGIEYGALWDWDAISDNENISKKTFCENPNYPWNWMYMYKRGYIHMETMLYNVRYDKQLMHLCRSNIISIELINYDKNYPWEFSHISCNNWISIQDIVNNLHLKWNWICVSYNPNLTWYDIAETLTKINKHHYLDWDYISQYVKIDITKDNLKKYPIDFYHLSRNQHLTWLDVHNHIDEPWDWENLSDNSFIQNIAT